MILNFVPHKNVSLRLNTACQDSFRYGVECFDKSSFSGVVDVFVSQEDNPRETLPAPSVKVGKLYIHAYNLGRCLALDCDTFEKADWDERLMDEMSADKQTQSFYKQFGDMYDALWSTIEDGSLVFKASSPHLVTVDGLWMAPEFRGKGLEGAVICCMSTIMHSCFSIDPAFVIGSCRKDVLLDKEPDNRAFLEAAGFVVRSGGKGLRYGKYVYSCLQN